MNRWGFRCFHCERLLYVASHGFCSRCIRLLNKHAYCRQCGSCLPYAQSHCGHCLQEEPKWQRIMQVATYKPPLADWIHRFKFQQQDWLDMALARLLLLEILQQRRECYIELPEVILPVPLFWQRQWQRGYNQATRIALHLARWLNIPLDMQSAQRLRPTASQRELTASQRRRNVKHAFGYSPAKPYRRVAIIDDVVTTGATLNALCAELRKQGVKEIQVWTLAKTEIALKSLV